MPLLRFQVAAQMDTTLPRDALVNTLHFDVATVLVDADALCEDLAEVFATGWYANPTQIVVNAYEIGPPPNFPVGHAEMNMGLSPESSCSREVAICLSYYAERNLPRQRGRIFLPLCGTSYSDSAPRPPEAQMQQALDLAGGFADLGGVDVDWQVYSPTDGQGRNVTNAWVDDEWDTIRSRGLRGSMRLMETVGP